MTEAEAQVVALKQFRLTANQFAVLRVFAEHPFGKELCSGQITGAFQCAAGTTSNRMRTLKRRDFLLDRWKHPYHLWRLGPKADAVMDAGLLDQLEEDHQA